MRSEGVKDFRLKEQQDEQIEIPNKMFVKIEGIQW